MKLSCDIAIIGSGFAGSLLAMIVRRLGRSVILIERGRHPRFAIGESSTPLANLLLDELAKRHDLPRVAALAKWGTWQRSHPQIACGIKRGFTFYHHEFGRPFQPQASRANELLVTASPHNEIADTHWYRPDFDKFLVEEAQALGVEYFDEVVLSEAEFGDGIGRLWGERSTKPFSVKAKFVVDATGPRGFLQQTLKLPEVLFSSLPPTCGLYTHFTGVRRFLDLIDGGHNSVPPYPPDDAALHHVFDGGWIWVLRFNNGITSAGVAMTDRLAETFKPSDGRPAWDRLLRDLPSVAEQFADSKPTLPFVHARKLSFRSSSVTGNCWALLPSAAGFVDPLLSTGFPLTLLGVARLARTFEESWGSAELGKRLRTYESQTQNELLAAERLVAALYANMYDFPIFAGLSLLYFAAASFSETAWRLDKPDLASSFLLHDQKVFETGLQKCCELALRAAKGHLTSAQRKELLNKILQTIAPIDVAGLSDLTRNNWYPARAEDLLAAAPKLGVDRVAIERLLARCGFTVVAASQRSCGGGNEAIRFEV